MLALGLLYLFKVGKFDRVVGAFYIFSMPLVVVMGDGFYEFEKHMIPFFMSFPILFLLIGYQTDSDS